ncbi:histone deacetylase superfamily protein [Halosimplex carlsbadense 2-9-1]|uniref:Histone deacetylase superfamily protein n=1 Tax=Halosimplex carlsbadense 2-9-1 TaxID=797114 RepID=M0CWK8_9EURY|nr:histone deacetylase [Halosimplex carlsbadense]ELZ27616.1 histone deacetylase superfamily protein [Halosimplex carlsbadense 2-9-1]
MNFGYREACLEHDTGKRHPESPDRLRAIRQGLSECHGVRYVSPEDATVEQVAAVHDADYVQSVEDFCADGGGDWDADTVAVEATWDAALAASGMANWVADEALDGSNGRDTTFALGRPPGHHAVYDDAMGFCFFNHVAVAAQHAIDDGGADRVAILDWDVHHGNGTQDIFDDREDVFFVSIHEDGIYPGTGDATEIGTGDARGTTMNVPFPPGTTTSGYLAAVDDLIVPAFEAFDPDLVLVSAGFDAHEHDPISRMRVSTEGYGLLAQRVDAFADRIGAGLGFVLEGGYGLDTLTESVRTVHEVFDGYTPGEPDGDVQDAARQVIDDVRGQRFDLADE